MKENDISAFPTCGYSPEAGTFFQEGMTLRDYFAAKVLNGILAEDANAIMASMGKEPEQIKRIARLSYGLADAMLKEREK